LTNISRRPRQLIISGSTLAVFGILTVRFLSDDRDPGSAGLYAMSVGLPLLVSLSVLGLSLLVALNIYAVGRRRTALLATRFPDAVVLGMRNYDASAKPGAALGDFRWARESVTLTLVADASGLSIWRGLLKPKMSLSIPWNRVWSISTGRITAPTTADTIVIRFVDQPAPLEFALLGTAKPRRRPAGRATVQAACASLCALGPLGV